MWFDKNESLYPASRVAFIFWEHARINCPEHLFEKTSKYSFICSPIPRSFHCGDTNKINLAEQKGQRKHCDTLFYQLWFVPQEFLLVHVCTLNT